MIHGAGEGEGKRRALLLAADRGEGRRVGQ